MYRLTCRGGTELLLAPPHAKTHRITLPVAQSSPPTVRTLVEYIRTHLVNEREELCVEGGSVRPGILVLINDSDWELEGEMNYELQSGDRIVFISTLHGG